MKPLPKWNTATNHSSISPQHPKPWKHEKPEKQTKKTCTRHHDRSQSDVPTCRSDSKQSNHTTAEPTHDANKPYGCPQITEHTCRCKQQASVDRKCGQQKRNHPASKKLDFAY